MNWRPAFQWYTESGRFGFETGRERGPVFQIRLWNHEIQMWKHNWWKNPLDRQCLHCGKRCGDPYPDPCLGKIPGVWAACCGHGDPGQAHMIWDSGLRIRGFRVSSHTEAADIRESMRRIEQERADDDVITVTFDFHRKNADPATMTDKDWIEQGKFVWALAGIEVGM